MVTAMQGHRARTALVGSRFAQVRWVAQTGSTNADALASAQAGASDGLVVVADHQTAGRGRRDRGWQASPGRALLVSVLVRPSLAPADAHLVTTAMGVAAAEASEALVGVPVRLKWPNDVVVLAGAGAGGSEVGAAPVRKLGGILAESIVEGSALRAVVVGLGLNVDWPEGPPPELRGRAQALAQVAGRPVDREDLLVGLLTRLEGWLAHVDQGRGRRLLARYRELSATIGARVRVEQVEGWFEGRALDVDGDGHLLVLPDEAPAGSAPRPVAVADVVHLRPV